MGFVITLDLISKNTDLPLIPPHLIKPIYDKSYDLALSHWIFGIDDNASFVDAINGRILTLNGDKPVTYHDHYLSMRSDEFGNYLDTGVMEKGDHSYVFAVRAPSTATGLIGVCGNRLVGGTQVWLTDGGFIPRAMPNGYLKVPVTGIYDQAPWVVIGITVTDNTMKSVYMANGEIGYREDALEYDREYETTRAFRLGTHSQSTEPLEKDLDFAEYMLFDQSLSLDELRSQVSGMYSRLTENGLV